MVWLWLTALFIAAAGAALAYYFEQIRIGNETDVASRRTIMFTVILSGVFVIAALSKTFLRR